MRWNRLPRDAVDAPLLEVFKTIPPYSTVIYPCKESPGANTGF